MGTEESKRLTKFSVRVPNDVYTLIEQQAARANLSPYAYSSDVLMRGVLYEQKQLADELLTPHIRAAVRQEVDRMLDSMNDFLLRTYMEAATGRRLAQLVLRQSFGDKERASKAFEDNWQVSYEYLRKDIRGIGHWRNLLDEVKAEGQGTDSIE